MYNIAEHWWCVLSCWCCEQILYVYNKLSYHLELVLGFGNYEIGSKASLLLNLYAVWIIFKLYG